MADEKAKTNIEVLIPIRLKGTHVGKGAVVAKTDFPNSGDWRNLCNMEPPRAKETDAAVKAAPKPKADAAKMPGAA